MVKAKNRVYSQKSFARHSKSRTTVYISEVIKDLQLFIHSSILMLYEASGSSPVLPVSWTHYHPMLDHAELWTPSNDTSRPICSDSLNLMPPASLYLWTLWRYTNAVIITYYYYYIWQSLEVYGRINPSLLVFHQADHLQSFLASLTSLVTNSIRQWQCDTSKWSVSTSSFKLTFSSNTETGSRMNRCAMCCASRWSIPSQWQTHNWSRMLLLLLLILLLLLF